MHAGFIGPDIPEIPEIPEIPAYGLVGRSSTFQWWSSMRTLVLNLVGALG